MLCVGITALVCLAITLFCFQTKVSTFFFKRVYALLTLGDLTPLFVVQVDFTSRHGLLFSLMMVLMITGLLLIFTVPFGYVSSSEYT